MIDTHRALQARADLEWVAGKWHELQNRLRKTGGDPNAPRVGGSKEPPSEIDWHVSNLLHEITEYTVFLGKVLIEESRWEPEAGTMPQLLWAVSAMYGHFTMTEDEKTAHDFCGEAARLRREVDKVINRPERARYIGPCSNANYQGAGCPGELWMEHDRDGGVCRVCGEAWSLVQQRMWLRSEMGDIALTYSETFRALKILGLEISERTWERWTSTGTMDRPRKPKIAKDDDDLYPLIEAVRMASALPKYRNSEDVRATVGAI